jgi:membrane protein YdbS with pleckstrin-like domain
MNNSTSTSAGMSLAGVITVVFVVLKLLGIIDWSWLWVLSPLWISAVLGLLFLLVVVFGLFSAQALLKWLYRGK